MTTLTLPLLIRGQPAERAAVASCDDCGACCMVVSIPPFSGVELRALPAFLRADVQQSFNTRQGHQPCAWLDMSTKRCRHYEHRPAICHDFTRSATPCHEARDREGV